MITEDKVAGDPGSGDGVHLGSEASLGLGAGRRVRKRQATRVGVVSQKHHDAFPAAGAQLPAQRAQDGLAGRVRVAGIADEIQRLHDLIMGERRDRWGDRWSSSASGDTKQCPESGDAPAHQAGWPVWTAFDFLWYARPMARASTTQIPASTRFTLAKPEVLNPSTVVPRYTRAADRRSPARTKNESIACLALYFWSRLVGRKRTLRTVLFTE